MDGPLLYQDDLDDSDDPEDPDNSDDPEGPAVSDDDDDDLSDSSQPFFNESDPDQIADRIANMDYKEKVQILESVAIMREETETREPEVRGTFHHNAPCDPLRVPA